MVHGVPLAHGRSRVLGDLGSSLRGESDGVSGFRVQDLGAYIGAYPACHLSKINAGT